MRRYISSPRSLGAARLVARTGLMVVVASCANSAASEPRTITDGSLNGESACDRVLVRDLAPEAARFKPDQLVSLRARIEAEGTGTCRADFQLDITHLGEQVHQETQSVRVGPGTPQTVVFQWDPPAEDFRGYLAVLSAQGEHEARSTGIDVSSTSLRYPRYGFISEFPPDQTQGESRAIVSRLSQEFHLNMFQMYDWFYRQEDLIVRNEDNGEVADSWTDLFGRVNDWSTITDLVEAVHDENALAMGYVTIYAAREGFEQLSGVSPAWGVYETANAEAQANVAFGGNRYLFLFDPSNPEWQQRMVREYLEAIDAANFDGVHIDQFGPRPTLYRADGTPVELNQTFAPFLETIDEALENHDPMRDACVFNLVDGAVDGYAVEEVATTSACDILYSEIWFTTDTYEDLRAYIEQLRRLGRGRAVVLAVYAQYGEDVGRVLEAEDAQLEGVALSANQPGFSGTGFVDQFDQEGDAITWTVQQDEDATVTYVFRYANASSQPATRTLEVDGVQLGKLTFGARGAWDDWGFDAWLQASLSAGEHRVRLLYAQGDFGALNVDRLTLGEFDQDSVLLQNAVIFASGATPIQLGDDVQSLSHEYFPNRSKTLTPSLQRALRSQYSFITAHESLLFAPEVVPIDARLERIEATSEGHTLITEGAGGIYTMLRSSPEGDIIHLVNLVGVDNERWRDAAGSPIRQQHVTLRYRPEGGRTVRSVSYASPDESLGAFASVPFTEREGYVEFELPSLSYWDVVLVRYD